MFFIVGCCKKSPLKHAYNKKSSDKTREDQYSSFGLNHQLFFDLLISENPARKEFQSDICQGQNQCGLKGKACAQ